MPVYDTCEVRGDIFVQEEMSFYCGVFSAIDSPSLQSIQGDIEIEGVSAKMTDGVWLVGEASLNSSLTYDIHFDGTLHVLTDTSNTAQIYGRGELYSVSFLDEIIANGTLSLVPRVHVYYHRVVLKAALRRSLLRAFTGRFDQSGRKERDEMMQ